jgi:acetylornithine deacetylase/succinyl-diaminopimelate desuccinylase-like protein
MRKILSALCLLFMTMTGAIASDAPASDAMQVVAGTRAWRESHENRILDELLEFLAIPNDANNLSDIRRKAEWIINAFARRGIELRLIETGGAPYVYGERHTPGAQRTWLFYCHYDGQSVDPSRWVGHRPWEPVFRNGRLEDGATIAERPQENTDPDWRIYARSASDDASPIVMLLAALDAMNAMGTPPGANLKFIFEGDEEKGSPNVFRFAEEHGELIGADFMFVTDGPKHPSGKPTVVFGVRGITSVQLTVYGPTEALHSGHFGNFAPNPAMRLAQLLATMKDPVTGEILVAGWQDDRVALSDAELLALADYPDDPARSPHALGFAEPEGPYERRVEAITFNSLNVRGLQSAWVGDEARTLVPDRAIAELDLRLVLNTQPDTQLQRLRQHIINQGFYVIDREPTAAERREHARLLKMTHRGSGYPAARTPMDLPISAALLERLHAGFEDAPVAVPTAGGSLPLYAFSEVAGIPAVTVPVVNHDNNQHAPNENIRLGDFWKGIEIAALLLTLE